MPKQLHIIALTDGKHKGDDNNALGTQAALARLYNNAGVNVSTKAYNLTELEQLSQEIDQSSDNFYVVIGAGEQSITPLTTLRTNYRDNVYTSWSGHEFFQTLSAAPSLPDSIALPTHIVVNGNKEFFADKSIEPIETIGVPHNTRAEDLLPEYEKWKERIIKAPHYTMVMLAGDAPEPDGTIHYYTKEEAEKLGYYIGKHALENNSVVLGTNGPRTGQHNPETKEKLLAHREIHPNTKEPLPYQLDLVSQAFIEGLRKAGCEENKHFQFFDFSFGKEKPISAYLGLLGAIYNNPGSYAYMPGESTSMVSEACDVLPHGNVIIYDNHAMNKSHIMHIDSVYNAGQAYRLTSDLTLLEKKNNIGVSPISAAETVAKYIDTKIQTVLFPEKTSEAKASSFQERYLQEKKNPLIPQQKR